MKHFSLLLVFIAITFFINGCSNNELKESKSGFFKSYDDLEENDRFEGTKVYINNEADFSKYENIYISPILVTIGLTNNNLSDNEKLLFKQMQEYLTEAYKQKIKATNTYKIVENKNLPKTLVYEGAVSKVAINFDDLHGMDVMPMMLIAKAISRVTYKDGYVRILGEGRLVDGSNDKVLVKMLRLHKGKEIDVKVKDLKFIDVESALDAWLRGTNENLTILHQGIKKHQKNK